MWVGEVRASSTFLRENVETEKDIKKNEGKGQNNCWPCSESQLANKEADSKSLQVGGQVDAALKPCGRDALY